MRIKNYVESAKNRELKWSHFIDEEESILESTIKKLRKLDIHKSPTDNKDFTQSPIPKSKSPGWKTRSRVHSGFVCIPITSTPHYDGYKVTKNIEIEDELTKFYQRKPEKKPEPSVPKRTIEQVLSIRPKDKMVVNGRINVHDLLTLQGSAWLNDSIINYYLEMQVQPYHTDIYCFNTFFIPKLASSGYTGVSRWVRNVDLFAKKLLIWPVHVGTTHWCLAVAEMATRTLWFFDSLYSSGEKYLKLLQNFLLQFKSERQANQVDHFFSFKFRCHSDFPKQANGFDCGVFAISFARDIIKQKNQSVEKVKFSFSQADMRDIRKRITQEIIDSHIPSNDSGNFTDSEPSSSTSDLEIL
jgi:hypothetical protein